MLAYPEIFPGVHKLEGVRVSGDPFLEAVQISEAVSGMQRALQRRPEFRAAARRQIGSERIPITHREPWSVVFPIGPVLYTAVGDGQYADETHMERVTVIRVEAGVVNVGTFCEIPAYRGETGHVLPKAEVRLGDKEPLKGIPALARMDEAFPELGLVWR